MIFESHAHYDDEQFSKDRDFVLKAIKSEGVGVVINPASNLQSAITILKLCEVYDHVYAGVGIHPHDVGDLHENDMETLLGLMAHEKVVAVGEIGLDYYYDHVPREVQKLWFREQLKLAVEVDLPVSVHSRDAHQDTYDLMMEYVPDGLKGVVHCYSGSVEMAKRLVDQGFYLGISGVVTFSNAKAIKDVVKTIPLEYLLIETDAPYMAPIPYRGKRNDSRYLKHMIEAIATIKGIDNQTVETQTNKNGKALFFPGMV